MTIFSVKVRVLDDSGIDRQIPVLLTDQGEIQLVTDFLLAALDEGKSDAYLNSIIKVTQLLLEFTRAQFEIKEHPQQVFENFIRCLYKGTIQPDGLDPLSLYWKPKQAAYANQLIIGLRSLLDWIETNASSPYASMAKEDSYNEWLRFATWYRYHQHNYCSDSSLIPENAPANKVLPVKRNAPDHDNPMTDAYFIKLYNSGFGDAIANPCVRLRNRLILILMHGGGLRLSEALHIWVNDITINTIERPIADVRLYHPETGQAPDGWANAQGEATRQAYLKDVYHLLPRTQMHGQHYLGWKSLSDNNEAVPVHWFPQEYGRLFSQLWIQYQQCLMRYQRHHPYAFITFTHQSGYAPLAMLTFLKAYTHALDITDLGKKKAMITPLSHRKAYANRLRDHISTDIVLYGIHQVSDVPDPRLQSLTTAQVDSILEKKSTNALISVVSKLNE